MYPLTMTADGFTLTAPAKLQKVTRAFGGCRPGHVLVETAYLGSAAPTGSCSWAPTRT